VSADFVFLGRLLTPRRGMRMKYGNRNCVEATHLENRDSFTSAREEPQQISPPLPARDTGHPPASLEVYVSIRVPWWDGCELHTARRKTWVISRSQKGKTPHRQEMDAGSILTVSRCRFVSYNPDDGARWNAIVGTREGSQKGSGMRDDGSLTAYLPNRQIHVQSVLSMYVCVCVCVCVCVLLMLLLHIPRFHTPVFASVFEKPRWKKSRRVPIVVMAA